MMDKIIRVAEEEFSLPPGVASFGSYNYMPQPFREAEADEYYHHVAHYTPQFMEYRQVKDLGEEFPFGAVKIFWFPRQGWAVRYPNKWRLRKEDDGPRYHLIWEEPIRYFKIGCDHVYKTVEYKHRTEERRVCTHCKASMWVDTS